MNPAIGVDLGTTNTVVAVQTDETGPRILEVLQPADERNYVQPLDHIKSAVYFESAENAVVGAFAARRLEAFRSVKSRMGTRWQVRHPHRKGISMRPAWISAHILISAYQQILLDFPEWDRRALITVPASFNTDQRNDTLRAASLAGFQDVQLLDEPTAAFYYFFEQHRDMFLVEGERTVLVFDFGGGTLDVSIIRVGRTASGLCIDPIGRSRYNNLGGDDIDLELASFFLALWEQQERCAIEDLPFPERATLIQLFIQRSSAFKEEAEDYLSLGQTPNEFILDYDLPNSTPARQIHFRRHLTRPQYEEISGRFFLDKGDLNIFRPIGQAVQVAASIVSGFKPTDIDLVLYTGGASRMAGLKAALDVYFAPKPCYEISHEEACNTVALGAASCRFDEQQAHQKVFTTSRLLESIFTRDDDLGTYVPIVPLTCEPSTDFIEVPVAFQLARPAVNLTLPLFRGVGPADHHLAPMKDLEFKLPKVIAANVPYQLSYRMTPNKTIEIRAAFTPEGVQAIRVDSTLEIHEEGKLKGPPKIPLARVN